MTDAKIASAFTAAEQREKVLAVAASWVGTPYHHAARIKKAGADCLTFIAGVYEEAGLIPHEPIPHYPPDWHLHRDAERYMEGLLQYSKEIAGPPLPGDIVVFKFGRCFSHGAIVTSWPQIVHSYLNVGCVYENVFEAEWLSKVGENTADKGKPRERRFFSYWS